MRTNVGHGLLFCFAVAVFLIVSAVQPASVRNRFDFFMLYSGGKILKEGSRVKLYDYETQLTVRRELGLNYPVPYNHPPFEALLVLPFAYLPPRGAYVLWGVFNIAILTIASILLGPYSKHFDTGSRLVLASVVLFPVLAVIGLGEDTALLFLAFVLSFLNLKKKRDFLAGCALGAGLFRFQLVLPLLVVFLVRRRWKAVLGALAVGGVFALASLLLVGWRGCLSYCNLLLSMTGKANQNMAYVVQTEMPALRGFLYLVLGSRLSPRSLGVLIALGSVALVWWLARRWGQSEDLEGSIFDLLFSLSTVVAIMVAYHLLLHDLLLLALPAVIVLDRCAREAASTGNRFWGLGKPLLVMPLVGLFLTELGVAVSDAMRFLGVSFCFLLFFAFAISKEITASQRALSRAPFPAAVPPQAWISSGP